MSRLRQIELCSMHGFMQAPPKKVPDFEGPTIENSIMSGLRQIELCSMTMQAPPKKVPDFGGPINN